MVVHNNPRFKIVFCDARDGFFPVEVLDNVPYPLDGQSPVFCQLAERVPLTSVVIPKGVHGIDGLFVDEANHQKFSSAPRTEGDCAVTALPGVGIGVLTADCLSFAIYDPIHHASAMVHAGWRGSVGRIGVSTLATMRNHFGTQPDQVEIFLGTCAHACCYQVNEDFLAHLAPFSCIDKVIQRRAAGIFFDLPLFNRLLLEDAGVRREAINSDYSVCTLCNDRFCSYRREGAASCRQLSLIVLT